MSLATYSLRSRFMAALDGIGDGIVHLTTPEGTRHRFGTTGPEADLQIRDWRLLSRLALRGDVGLGEGWVAGDWHSETLEGTLSLALRNLNLRATWGEPGRFQAMRMRLTDRLLRRNSQRGSQRNIRAHYDVGNEFYQLWLDPGMTYSSALFGKDDDLHRAQARKNDRILSQLSPGESLLEIGCGWGGLAEAALERAAIAYHGISLSPGQTRYAEERLAGKGDWKISLTDYRDAVGQYDAVASVEMVEAVGQQYWPDYLDCIARCLKPGGRAALQYIRIEDDIFEQYADGQDFIQRFVFPGGMLLSESRFRALAEARGLRWEGQIDYGLHYAETLRMWRGRFEAAVAEGRLPAGFDEKFVALWRFYLMYCEGGFRGGGINVAQVTLVNG